MTLLRINKASDLKKSLSYLPSIDSLHVNDAKERQNILTKPPGSLGRLEEIAIWLSGWQRKTPQYKKSKCIVFAGNHGVAKHGVSAFPTDVTRQMVENFRNGGAAINQITNLAKVDLEVVELDLDNPTNDFTKSAAMSEQDCCNALQAGANAVTSDLDILLLGEMGIANTTSAAAVALSTFGKNVDDWVGYGTGIDDKALQIKKDVVKLGYNLHKSSQKTSFDILRTVGGRELAAIAGAVLEARKKNIPVILDGFISSAAAAVLTYDNEEALDHTLISHLSVEQGHHNLVNALNKNPILNLDMRLGEASGAALAFLIIKAAVETHNGMATFSEAGVSSNG